MLCLIHQNDGFLLKNKRKEDWKDLTLLGRYIEKMNL